MKIRHGFVSNSSSSSFVIRLESSWISQGERRDLISREEIGTLLNYGFEYTQYRSATQLQHSFLGTDTESNKETEYLGYEVTCNEDEVIGFLVKHNIPFHASKHYGNTSVFFARDSKEILFVDNLGQKFEMYEWKDDSYKDESVERLKQMTEIINPIRVELVEDYIKEYDLYQKNREEE